MKSFFSKLLFLSLTLALLVTPAITSAQCTGPFCSITSFTSTCSGGSCPFSSSVDYGGCTGDSCALSTADVLGSGQAQDPDQALQQEDQQDQQQCQQELGINGLVIKAGSLSNLVASNLSQQLPQSLSQFMNQQFPTLLQNQLAAALPQVLNSQLRGVLPGYVNNAISGMLQQGLSSSQISSALPNIITNGVTTLTPQILNHELPNLIQQTVQNNLPSYLGRQSSSGIAAALRNNPEFMARIAEMVKTAADSTHQAASDAQSTAEDVISQTRSGAGLLGLVVPVGNIDTSSLRGNVSAADQQIIVEGVLAGVASTTADSVASDPAWGQLTRDLMPQLNQILMQQVMPHLLNTFQSGLTEAGGSFGGLNTTLNGLVGNNYDFSRGVLGDSFFKPVVDGITPAMGSWARAAGGDLASSIQSGFSPSVVASLNDGYLPTAAMGQIATNVTPAVQAAAPSIANNAVFSQQGLSNLSNSLKGGLSSSIGGLVGGLTDNIPFVGGLISPLVEQMTTQFLNGLLGVTAGGGLPVMDVGTHQGESSGNKISSKVEGNTKTSNENEKKLQQTQDKALDIATQACTHAKALERMAREQEKARFVEDRDARKKAWTSYATLFNETLKAASHAHNVSGVPGADQGQNGQSLIADQTQNRQEAVKEAQTLAEQQVKANNSGNLYGDEVSAALTNLNQSSFTSEIKSTLTQEEAAAMNDPSQVKNLSNQGVWDLVRKGAEFSNNWIGSFLLATNYSQTKVEQAQKDADQRFVAYNGFNNTRQCKGWTQDSQGQMQCTGGWVTLTPGSTLKDQLSKLAGSPLDWYASTHTVGEDFVGPASANLGGIVTNLRQATQQGLPQSNVSSQGLCPGPGPCQNTGYTPQASDNSALGQAVSTSLNNLAQQNAGGSSNNSGSNSDLDNLANLLNGLNFNINKVDTTPKIIYFRQNEDKSKLQWYSRYTIGCQAGNDWGGTDKTAQTSLSPIGESALALTSATTYTLVCFDGNNNALTQTLTIKP